MKVIGYCRVSTEEQASQGVSLDAQRSKIESWAQAHGHELVTVLSDDGISGKSMNNRKNLLRALELVKAEKGIFVVYSLLRMSRSVRNAIDIIDGLHQAGCHFSSLTEAFDTTTAMGEFFFVIVAAFGQLERKMIVERTNFAMQHKRRNGEALGNTPYGFRNDNPGRTKDSTRRLEPAGRLIPDADEQRGLKLLLELRSSTPNCASIARALDAANIKPRSAASWDRGRVRKILKFYETPAGKDLLESSRPFRETKQLA